MSRMSVKKRKKSVSSPANTYLTIHNSQYSVYKNILAAHNSLVDHIEATCGLKLPVSASKW